MIIHTYSDPGHGWARVPRRLLHQLGIAQDITPYSYQRGTLVYLEEDCDLTTLVCALKAAGIRYTFKGHVSRERPSRIRGYESYVPRVELSALFPVPSWVLVVSRSHRHYLWCSAATARRQRDSAVAVQHLCNGGAV